MGWVLGGPDPVSFCLVAFVIVMASRLPSYLCYLTAGCPLSTAHSETTWTLQPAL